MARYQPTSAPQLTVDPPALTEPQKPVHGVGLGPHADLPNPDELSALKAPGCPNATRPGSMAALAREMRVITKVKGRILRDLNAANAPR